MKTWHAEHAVVACVLGAVAWRTGNSLAEWIGALAVLASFGHASVAERLREREAARPVPLVECYRKLGMYFVAKEAFWVLYFVLHRSWSALVGCGIFLLYPAWRTFWRRIHPLEDKP